MRHWYLLAILSTITFLSTIDFFLNNNTLADGDHLDCMDLSWTNHWVWFSLAGFVICWAVVLLHRYCKLALVVRMVEAIVSLVIIGAYGYIVASFTGGRLDQVPCRTFLFDITHIDRCFRSLKTTYLLADSPFWQPQTFTSAYGADSFYPCGSSAQW